MKAYAIRHVAFEDLGLWTPLLTAEGRSVRYFQAGIDDLHPCLHDAPDLLVVLGGPIGVYEQAQYPFIDDELAIIRERIAKDLPTIGICLGAQMIAAAMGAKVYPSGMKEIGWYPLTLTSAGHQSCLQYLADSDAKVLHWHGDTFDLPDGATLLASTAQTPNQAFAVGSNILALQFHIEADPRLIDQWLIGHACELSQAGISPSSLRDASKKISISFRAMSAQILSHWLDQMIMR